MLQSHPPLGGHQELSMKLNKVILQRACIKNDSKATEARSRQRDFRGPAAYATCQLGARMTQFTGSHTSRSKGCSLLQTVDDTGVGWGCRCSQDILYSFCSLEKPPEIEPSLPVVRVRRACD